MLAFYRASAHGNIQLRLVSAKIVLCAWSAIYVSFYLLKDNGFPVLSRIIDNLLEDTGGKLFSEDIAKVSLVLSALVASL